MEKTMSKYEQQAEQYLNKYGIKFSVKYLKHDKYFSDDKESRDIFKVRLSRGRNSMTTTFGQSIAEKGQEPSAYSVLVCLGSDDPYDSFQEFCDNYGYDTDSRNAERIYKAVKKQYEALQRVIGYNSEYNPLWNDLRKIQ